MTPLTFIDAIYVGIRLLIMVFGGFKKYQPSANNQELILNGQLQEAILESQKNLQLVANQVEHV